jgi:tetratricopeptide (TPR) repeat protein
MSAVKMLKWIFAGLLIIMGTAFFALSADVDPENPAQMQCLNSEKSHTMILAGQEAFDRGKYSQSLNYFKKAIQADSTSEKAWSWYNITLSYALAEMSKQITYPEFTTPQKANEADEEWLEVNPMEEDGTKTNDLKEKDGNSDGC